MAAALRDHSRRRRQVVRGAAAVVVLSLSVAATGCGGSARVRLEARDDLVDQLVDGGLEREVAECAVDGFFSPRSNAELEAFFDRPALTADERDEFARLGMECSGFESG